MTISFDNAADLGHVSATSLTASFTISGSNPILHIGVTASDGVDPTGVTYNGVALTKVDFNTTEDGWHLSLWELIAPPTGAHNVVVTLGYSGNMIAVACSHNGAAQTGQPNAHNNTHPSGSTDFAHTITSTVDNCWALLFQCGRDSGSIVNPPTAGSGTTARIIGSSWYPIAAFYDANAAISPAGVGTLNVHYANSSSKSYGASVTIAPAASGPTPIALVSTDRHTSARSLATTLGFLILLSASVGSASTPRSPGAKLDLIYHETIAFDNAADLGSTTGTSLTTPFTISGIHPILHVGVTSGDGAEPSGITYNGTALTKLYSYLNGFGWRGSLWELTSPVVGTHNIVITFATSNTFVAVACSHTGASPTSQPNALLNTNADGSSFAVSVTSTVNKCWGLMFQMGRDGTSIFTPPSPGAGTTTRIIASSWYPIAAFFDSNGPKTPAGTITMNIDYTTGSSNDSTVIAIAPGIASTPVPLVNTDRITSARSPGAVLSLLYVTHIRSTSRITSSRGLVTSITFTIANGVSRSTSARSPGAVITGGSIAITLQGVGRNGFVRSKGAILIITSNSVLSSKSINGFARSPGVSFFSVSSLRSKSINNWVRSPGAVILVTNVYKSIETPARSLGSTLTITGGLTPSGDYGKKLKDWLWHLRRRY